MDSWGEPGLWLFMVESSSSSVNSAPGPPRCIWRSSDWAHVLKTGVLRAAPKGLNQVFTAMAGSDANEVVHGGEQLLLGELGSGPTALHLAVVHEGRLVGRINRPALGNFPSSDWAHVLKTGVLRAAPKGLNQVFTGSTENASLENMSPIGGGEVTQGRAVNQGGYHLGQP
jgi:4-aminobutyrate aminotransferase/(S)-3-amino-2-methylpropionate transaminase